MCGQCWQQGTVVRTAPTDDEWWNTRLAMQTARDRPAGDLQETCRRQLRRRGVAGTTSRLKSSARKWQEVGFAWCPAGKRYDLRAQGIGFFCRVTGFWWRVLSCIAEVVSEIIMYTSYSSRYRSFAVLPGLTMLPLSKFTFRLDIRRWQSGGVLWSIGKVPKGSSEEDILVVLGDWNSQIGPAAYEKWTDTVGRFGLLVFETNECGLTDLEFTQSHWHDSCYSLSPIKKNPGRHIGTIQTIWSITKCTQLYFAAKAFQIQSPVG